MEEEEKNSAVTERELLSAVQAEVAGALGSETSKLSEQRSKAMKYYYGEPYGDEKKDRSHIVTREVMDTIEWLKPELMKKFASGAETVRFEPQDANDVQAAQQATDYINYLFHRKNNGFKVLYEWINDGLLQKNGIVKVFWDGEKNKTREEYKGLTEQELMLLARRDDVELLSQDSYDDPIEAQKRDIQLQQGQQQLAQVPDPMAQAQMQMQLQALASQPIPQLYDVAVLVTGAEQGLKLEVIPPEEFIISSKAKSIEDSPFCAHTREMTISDLKAMGYEDLEGLPSGQPSIFRYDEKQARHSYDDTDDLESRSHSSDAMKEVWVTEAYIKYDYDDDGLAELRKVVYVGDRILENEMVDCMPFAGWTPIIISHKFHGLSMADLVSDLQLLHSQLFRNMLDNQYLTNNGRYVAVEGMVNLDDLLTSRPHGVVRTKMANAVSRLDTPQLSASAFQMLGYVDQLREKRTGVSERTQGLDAGQLGANQAATAVNQVMTAAQQRIELIARVFGETGLTDLFRLMYKLVIQNQTRKDIFRLRDQYVEVDPSEWRERKDTSVVVGLGNGSREQEMLQLNMIFQAQMQLLANPATANIIDATNIYATLEDQVKVFDKAASGRYFTDPQSPQAQQKAQAQQQQQQQIQQMQQQIQNLQMQLEQKDREIDEFEAQTKRMEAVGKLQLGNDELDQQKVEHEDDTALATAELAAEIELEDKQGRGVELG